MKKIILIGGDPNSINSEIILKSWRKISNTLKKFRIMAQVFRNLFQRTVEKTANHITFTFEQDLKDENIYLELEKIYEEATCESYLQIEAYGKKIFAEETLNKMEELGFKPYIEEVTSKNFNGILFRVMIGPMQSISDTNNARETLIRADFLPHLRTRCIQT